MTIYEFHYRWVFDGRDGGENTQKFDASSDEEAKEKVQKLIKEHKKNILVPETHELKFVFLRLMKEIPL